MHLFIKGYVTGVGFRSWVLQKAVTLQLTGWVRNAERKVVELVAEGDKENLSTLLTHCKKGPEISCVEDIDAEWGDETGEFSKFTITY